MIKIEKLVCTRDCQYGKNTFTKGKEYYGRNSLNDTTYLIKSNEEKMAEVIHFDWAKSGVYDFRDNFSVVGWFLIKDKKELKGVMG
jgi:hypothetical protein